MKIAAVTGHRPNRILDMNLVHAKLHETFIDLDVDHVIQGMADGVDLTAAKAAFYSGTPFSCARPWVNHAPGEKWKQQYEFALNYAENVWIVNDCEGYPGPQVYQERNEFMVDRAHLVIAVWDGVKKGGTWNCIKYAVDGWRPVWRIDPRDGEAGWYTDVTTS